MDVGRALGLSADRVSDLRDHLERRSHAGRDFEALPDRRYGVERGTILADDAVVRGFPKTPRVLVAETGIPERFDGPVAVEEKLNGYNVRVARVALDGLGPEPFAFTRGGHVCPFTTRRLRRTLPLSDLFDAHPDLVLCGEMVGSENPYTAYDYPGVESLAFFAFDLRELDTGTPLPVAERREILDGFDIGQVPLLGTYGLAEVVDGVLEHVRDLDDEGREGVVMKSTDGSKLLKYTTSVANQGDLSFAFSLPFDYGQSFMFRRIIREAFQAVELDERGETLGARSESLGRSILEPMVETIRAVGAGETVGERHTVRGTDAEITALLSHLDDQGLTVSVLDDRYEDGDRVVEYRKDAQSSTDKCRLYLDGHVVTE